MNPIKYLSRPLGMMAAVGAIIASVTGSGNTLIDLASRNELVELGSKSSQTAIAASSSNKSCFDKIQDLENGHKQGVSICFEESLENIKFDYFSISPEGIRSNSLKDKEKFKEFVKLVDLENEIKSTDKNLKKQVKGINSNINPIDSVSLVRQYLMQSLE